MKLKEMKVYLENVRRFKKTLVALQLVAAAEIKEVRKIVGNMFSAYLMINRVIKKARKRFDGLNCVIIPFTIDATGCGLHNTMIHRFTLFFIGLNYFSSHFLLCIGIRARLFFQRQLSNVFVIEIRTILKEDISYYLAYLMFLTFTKIPRWNTIYKLVFIINKFYSAMNIVPIAAQMPSYFLFFLVMSQYTRDFSYIASIYEYSTVVLFFELLIENHNSGTAHKITSLTDAVYNCEDLVKVLVRKYNRLRQESITGGLLELVPYMLI